VIATTGVKADRKRDLNGQGGPDRALCSFLQDRIERLQSEPRSIEADSPEITWRPPGLSGSIWNRVTGFTDRAGRSIQDHASSGPCDL